MPQATWTGAGPDQIYNYNMAQATAGAMTLGSSRDDPVGHTSQLPGWTAWGQGSATVVADAAWPGGYYVKMTFGGVGDGTNGTIDLTTDLFPVVAGSQITIQTMQAYNVPSGVTLNVQYAIAYFTAADSYISSSASSMTKPGVDSLGVGVRITGTAIVPSNARYARIEVSTWETVAHDATTYFELGSVALLMQWSFGNYLNDLTITGTTFPTGNLVPKGQVDFASPIYPGTISTNTDNWNPTGLATANALVVFPGAAFNLSGIVAPSTYNQTALLVNDGSFTITLLHDSTSTAANRFYCPGSVNFSLTANKCVWLWYDFAVSRWRVVG